jgi:hypothetical protein
MSRQLGSARAPPSELARRLLLDLEDAIRPHVQNEWGGGDVLGKVRLATAQLVEALEPARWRGKDACPPRCTCGGQP